MPALEGQIISTIPDSNGNTLVAAVVFFDPATRALRSGTVQTVRDGPKSGALVVDNVSPRPVTVRLANDASGNRRTVDVPARGAAFAVADLAARNISTLDDVNGFTFDFS